MSVKHQKAKLINIQHYLLKMIDEKEEEEEEMSKYRKWHNTYVWLLPVSSKLAYLYLEGRNGHQ